MHMNQVRELLFRGSNDPRPDTESDINLEETLKNQVETESSSNDLTQLNDSLEINYESSNSESDDEFGLLNEQAENFSWKVNLAEWKHTHDITDVAMNDLLPMMKRLDLDLPADARSLTQTPRNLVMKSIGGGSYYHFGIAEQIQKLLEKKLYFHRYV